LAAGISIPPNPESNAEDKSQTTDKVFPLTEAQCRLAPPTKKCAGLYPTFRADKRPRHHFASARRFLYDAFVFRPILIKK
jgi:hypothetical protein